MKSILITMLLGLIAVPAIAGAPQTGVYLSDDMGGQMLTGHFSESWMGAGGMWGETVPAVRPLLRAIRARAAHSDHG